PIGTLVQVTNLANGKSVKVRITDRGIRDRKVKIDLCREAAEELEMVSKGFQRVRMQVIPEEQGAGADDRPTTAAAQ
ncbi:MAG TPA: RlpA-like double-psi beta-barrel domain-containing protein, partial [Chthoniobacterales bacterium]